MCKHVRAMSGHDLYLVLRERVETVAKGFHIDKDVLDAAQAARGYSHERMGRELDISEKTWRRWKADEIIPYDQLDAVAEVLRLEVERPHQKVELRDVSEEAQPGLEDLVARLIGLLEEDLAQRREQPGDSSERRG